MKKILIVSTLPETAGIGGVTIHTKRLLESPQLKSSEYQLIFFDYKNQGIREYLDQLRDVDVVHIHISNPKARIAFVSLARIKGKKVLLTVHGNLGRHGALKNMLDNLTVRLADIPILINKQSFEKAKKLNPLSVMVPAFIPPQTSEQLPQQVESLVENIDRAKYKTVYATNASKRNYDDMGNEIYGIDFLIDVFTELPDRLLIVSDPSGDYTESLEKSSIPENIIIIKTPHSFFELLKKCDGMIRATSTDGDALSIKEALYLRRQVIATDCVDRPEGTVLFEYNDKESFIKALEEADGATIKQSMSSVEDAISHLKQIYLTV